MHSVLSHLSKVSANGNQTSKQTSGRQLERSKVFREDPTHTPEGPKCGDVAHKASAEMPSLGAPGSAFVRLLYLFSRPQVAQISFTSMDDWNALLRATDAAADPPRDFARSACKIWNWLPQST